MTGDVKPGLEILYQSMDLLAINKPSGISLLADRSGAPCLWDQLREHLALEGLEPLSVHRIDKGTSGVLLVALSRARQAELTRAFQHRSVRKFYLARVVGDLDGRGTTCRIDLPLVKGRKSRYRVAGPRERIIRGKTDWTLNVRAAAGHASTTRLRRIGGDTRHTLLALQPLTGRTHQLRVHLAWIGHPIVGDTTRGGREHERLCLHAYSLAFPHPPDQEMLKFESQIEFGV